MIHFEDAEAAFTAVMGTSRLPSLPIFTLLAVLHFHVLALKWWLHACLDPTWVGKRSPQMAEDCTKTQSIENEEVEETFGCQRYTLDELLVYQGFFVPVENVSAISNILSVEYQTESEMGERHPTQVLGSVHFYTNFYIKILLIFMFASWGFGFRV